MHLEVLENVLEGVLENLHGQAILGHVENLNGHHLPFSRTPFDHEKGQFDFGILTTISVQFLGETAAVQLRPILLAS